jgi:hypothetical protein
MPWIQYNDLSISIEQRLFCVDWDDTGTQGPNDQDSKDRLPAALIVS